MWKKPSLQKPDFKKVNLDELSDRESIETNGGVTSIITDKPLISPFINPPLSGVIAIPYPILSERSTTI